MIKPQKRSLRQTIVGGIATLASIVLPGCFTGGGVEPVVGFGAQAIQNMGIEYEAATSIGVRGKGKIPVGKTKKSSLEIEAEVSTYTTNGEAGIFNHDVTATEVSANVLYPVWSNGKGDIYVGAGATNTSQTVTESNDMTPDSSTFSQSETDARVFVGGRLKAGKGNIDARVTAGSRGTSASLGYEFTF